MCPASPGLSSETIAIIGLGCGVGVLAVIACVAIAVRRKKRSGGQSTQTLVQPVHSSDAVQPVNDIDPDDGRQDLVVSVPFTPQASVSNEVLGAEAIELVHRVASPVIDRRGRLSPPSRRSVATLGRELRGLLTQQQSSEAILKPSPTRPTASRPIQPIMSSDSDSDDGPDGLGTAGPTVYHPHTGQYVISPNSGTARILARDASGGIHFLPVVIGEDDDGWSDDILSAATAAHTTPTSSKRQSVSRKSGRRSKRVEKGSLSAVTSVVSGGSRARTPSKARRQLQAYADSGGGQTEEEEERKRGLRARRPTDVTHELTEDDWL